MFTQPHGGKAISDEGFEVVILSGDRNESGVAYYEDGKLLVLEGYFPFTNDPESLGEVPLVLQVPNDLRWLERNKNGMLQQVEGGTLSQADKSQVLNRIRQALEFMREPFKLVGA